MISIKTVSTNVLSKCFKRNDIEKKNGALTCIIHDVASNKPSISIETVHVRFESDPDSLPC